MKIYLVGGAVRDQLLGLPIEERDWLVVGATPEQLIAQGFQPVGKEFPVFLHPETHEEYALARTERKVGKGYKGFTFYAAADVTLEQDLMRRDLTINAMAQDSDGTIIDPYQGQQDLENKVLRHVSPAFSEDPVRILRLARFAAKLPDFEISHETVELMIAMVQHGEVDALVAERVWQELSRALDEKVPARFFITLDHCQALNRLFPEIATCANSMRALKQATQKTFSAPIKFAALLHDTDSDQFNAFCQRYKVPKEFADLGKMTRQHHSDFARCLTLNAEEITHLLKHLDAQRRPQRFRQWLRACIACYPDKTSELKRLLHCAQCLRRLDISELKQQPLVGEEFAKALQILQIRALEHAIN